MTDNLWKTLTKCGKTLAFNTDDLSETQIKKADYDKTYVGWVAAKRYVDPNKTGENDDFRWCIQTDRTEYEIKPEMSNITEIGQRVRLYVPNHEYKYKYAEVIEYQTTLDYVHAHPEKIVYNDKKDTVTEYWLLSDKTIEEKVFILTVINKDQPDEQVTKITFPDKSEMDLQGFNTVLF